MKQVDFNPERAIEFGKTIGSVQKYQENVKLARAHYDGLIENEVGNFEVYAREVARKLIDHDPTGSASKERKKAESARKRKQQTAKLELERALAVIDEKKATFSDDAAKAKLAKEKKEAKQAEKTLDVARENWNAVKAKGPAWNPKWKYIVVGLLALGEFGSNLPVIDQFNPDIPPIAGIKPIFFVALLALVLTAASMYCAEFIGEHIKMRKFDVMTGVAATISLGFGVIIALARANHVDQAMGGTGAPKVILFMVYLALYLLFATVSALFGYNSTSSSQEYKAHLEAFTKAEETYQRQHQEYIEQSETVGELKGNWLEQINGEKQDIQAKYEESLTVIDQEFEEDISRINQGESRLRDELNERHSATQDTIQSHSQTLTEWISNFTRGAHSNIGDPKSASAALDLHKYRERLKAAYEQV
jgi:hypothetical protein